MKKLNKKGFTLIEMLVVIAIIAILVSIIVPVVGNSTTKAAAATNAANLRSVAAEVSIKHLEDPVDVPAGQYTATADGTLTIGTATFKTPLAKDVKGVVAGKTPMIVTITNEDVIATYGPIRLENFAEVAEDGKVDEELPTELPSTGREPTTVTKEVPCDCETGFEGYTHEPCTTCGHSYEQHGNYWHGECTGTKTITVTE